MLEDNPLWYKDAIIYELHVRAFHDSVGDGIGDFQGLTQKLDYLQDLGITAIWLLPFYPSPLRDDGYDIADYISINPQYGNLRDFREFLDAAHERGLRVITELVINHTSDQHPWFQRARRSPPGSPARDFYVWSDTPNKYRDARIIFKDFETSNWSWDPVAKAYYWHRFYSHQPDLNFDNPAVWEALYPVLDFWLGMGVDGMRLDAVPYLFEREGTNCENLPETHQFLKALRRHMDSKFKNRMLLAEANQWPEDSVVYFGDGDEAHMCFHFPVMPRMFMAIHMEDRFPIIDILAQTPEIHPTCQWAMFLRNHDELTLEMVTDEERDYMYRAYAHDPQARINLGIRRRLAPLLGNNRRRIELMNGLLASMPGTPVLYYGEEIGMGDNIYLGDRNGVRTPMQWSSDRNAGFSRTNPQKLYLPVIIDPEYSYEAYNVEAQQSNPNSLLWWMKRLIALRKQHKAFGRGTFEVLEPANRRILAFLRRWHPDGVASSPGSSVREGEECILVVANLSRFVQYVELDMSAFAGIVPIELFGRNPFPQIGELPYLLTLGPHSFYWFLLSPTGVSAFGEKISTSEVTLPVIETNAGWESIFKNPALSRLESILPGYIAQRRWFGGKARTIKSASVSSSMRMTFAGRVAYITLITVEYLDGAPENYLLPLTFTSEEQSSNFHWNLPHVLIANIKGKEEGVLYDALGDGEFCASLLEGVATNKSFVVSDGEVNMTAFPSFAEVRGPAEQPLTPSLSKTEQSNSSIIYGNRLIMKVFRRVEKGVNPDLELSRYLYETAKFAHVPPVVGAIEHKSRRGETTTLAIAQGFVPNEGDAWNFTLDVISRFFETVLASDAGPPPMREVPLLELADIDPPDEVRELLNGYLVTASLLGQRTGEMHLALAGELEDVQFTAESFSTLYQRSVYQSMRNLKGQVFQQLHNKLGQLPEASADLARQLIAQEDRIMSLFKQLMDKKITSLRTRNHGDYHLGQVLYTGKDFVIIDFEGEPARSINDRRVKRSPIRDVAGMVRSFHYAAYSPLASQEASGNNQMPGIIREEDIERMERWARFWYSWVAASFLHSYRETVNQASFVPQSNEEWRLLLDAFVLEKAVYELGYELNHRPDWVHLPLWGILQLLDS